MISYTQDIFVTKSSLLTKIGNQLYNNRWSKCLSCIICVREKICLKTKDGNINAAGLLPAERKAMTKKDIEIIKDALQEVGKASDKRHNFKYKEGVK